MTSWIRAPRIKKAEEETVKPFFFKVDDTGDFCGQFNSYLYSYMYSRANGRPLVIYDQGNSIGANYPLLREPFEIPEGVEYSDSILPTAINMSARQSRLVEFLSTLGQDQLVEAGVSAFQWTTGMTSAMEELLAENGVPVCDIGIHITQGTVLSHMDAAKAHVAKEKLEAPNVFVVAPAIQLADFKRRAPPSWKIHTISERSPTTRVPARIRQLEYVRYLAQLYALQSAGFTLVSLMNAIGKFLFLTSNNCTSVDTQRFSFF